MKSQYLPVLLLLLSGAILGQTKGQMIPQTVEFPSGRLRLKAYLWKPAGPGPFPAVLFSHGSGGETADLTAGMQITESADILAPFFLKHGYAFLYPFRRGHGPSAHQAPFMQHKPHSLKIYPKVGLTSNDGHNLLYENIPAWEDDVFTFLDQHIKG